MCMYMRDGGYGDENEWRETIKQQLEDELDRRVREALETPPPSREKEKSALKLKKQRERTTIEELQRLNSHIHLDLTDKEAEYFKSRKWKAIQAKRKIRRMMAQSQSTTATKTAPVDGADNDIDFDDDFQGIFGFLEARGVKSHAHYAKVAAKAKNNFASLTAGERHEFYYAFTRAGFKDALRTGRLPDGSELRHLGNGKYVDKYGIVRDEYGPFWPPDYGPLYPTPTFIQKGKLVEEPYVLAEDLNEENLPTIDSQTTPYTAKWRGIQIIFDSEKSSKDYPAPPLSEGHCPSLTFEARFESGNLRQARRIGEFEYELVLKTDLYTSRHTQWYYFRVQNALPGITYKFKIINLLKRDSLYNHGMRPLLYSVKNAESRNTGWVRTGHHISYIRNTSNLQCPLLARDRNYYCLEWQSEFPNANDTYYMAHCYPYTYTDLKDDLDNILNDPVRSKVITREVMCETRAGNSCFLCTVTNFECTESEKQIKKGIVITARVHPGETNSSWMMKGLLDFITGPSYTAKQLRNKFVFKIVPMLNPDGVIVGNYRCSLAAKDLNRNYRHPRKESFPTVYHTKSMMEAFGQWHDIVLYCDLHGHSRKQNVFMYGCNTSDPKIQFGANANNTEVFLKERLFPWLMSQKAPDRFSFRGCKFQIKRCKESTGRVVMFKQLNIHNSFTMEATFCGTNICKGDKRHFNTKDYQYMGQILCETILEYQHAQDNEKRRSELVSDLTRAIAQQVLQSQGILPPDTPDISTERGREMLKAYSPDGKLTNPDDVTKAFLKLVNEESKRVEPVPEPPIPSSSKSKSKKGPRISVDTILDQMAGQSMKDCVQLLDQLDVQDARIESDSSSDSDSESEPEMKYVEPKPRRKKKKHKKHKNEGHQSREQKHKTDKDDRPNSASGLPAIPSDQDGQKKKKQLGDHGIKRYMKNFAKNQPTFVNKYSGRSNGGIPCFSEERLLERASKRMIDMKKRMQQEQARNEAMYFVGQTTDDEYQRNYPHRSMNFSRSHTHTELRNNFQHPIHIRTGYMHAETGSIPEVQSHSDLSDTDSDSDLDISHHMLPIAAINSPYQNMGSHSADSHKPLLPLQPRNGRLPTMNHKKLDSCSIPLRHTTNNMVVTSMTPRGNVGADPLVTGHRGSVGSETLVTPHRGSLGSDTRGSEPFGHNKQRAKSNLMMPKIESSTKPFKPHAPRCLASLTSRSTDSLEVLPSLTPKDYGDVLIKRLKPNHNHRHMALNASTNNAPGPDSRRAGHRHSTCE